MPTTSCITERPADRHLVAVGVHGEAQGLRPGQTLTDARAVCPTLVSC